MPEVDLMSLPINTLIAAYRQMRTTRDAAKTAFTKQQRPTLDGMEKIETELQRRMNDEKVLSFAVVEGTAYQSHRNSSSVKDRSAFFAYVHAHNLWDLVDLKANVKAIEAFMKANDGQLPPGVSFSSELRVNVRATQKGKADE